MIHLYVRRVADSVEVSTAEEQEPLYLDLVAAPKRTVAGHAHDLQLHQERGPIVEDCIL